MKTIIEGKIFVLGDNIDTDQIIPAEYLVYRLSDAEERKMYGRYALSGAPIEQSGLPQGGIPFVEKDTTKSIYNIIVGGKNFGCGSSREHAPFALREAGAEIVIAEFFARIFYRNCVNGGYLAPVESVERLVDVVKTGDNAVVDLTKSELLLVDSGKKFSLKSLGDVMAILQAGDVFEYAKASGMMK